MASVETENKIARGARAKQTLDSMADTFARLQAAYMAQLVMATRKGEDIHTPATMLSVLDDVVEDLRSMQLTGQRAEKKLAREVKREHIGENATEL